VVWGGALSQVWLESWILLGLPVPENGPSGLPPCRLPVEKLRWRPVSKVHDQHLARSDRPGLPAPPSKEAVTAASSGLRSKQDHH
jgi:hypothetical protein